MRSTTRAARRLSFLLPLLLLGAAPGAVQAAANNVPWIYKGSDVPQDPAWTFGTLSNHCHSSRAMRNKQRMVAR